MDKRVIPPFQGASDSPSFFDQPELTCSPARIRNVRAFDVRKDRGRIGQRPGIVDAYGQVGTGLPGQGLGVVSLAPLVTGYAVTGSNTLFDSAYSRVAGTLAGHVWQLSSSLGLWWNATENIDAFSTAASVSSVAYDQAVSGSNYVTHIATGMNYVDGSGRVVGRVTVWITGLNRSWTFLITNGSRDVHVNCLKFVGECLLVGTSDGRVVVFRRADNISPFETETLCNGWSSSITGIAQRADGTVLVCFTGSDNAGGTPLTLASGAVVTDGKYAKHWRAGVMHFSLSQIAGVYTLTQLNFSTMLASNDRHFEANHQYCRFSEKWPVKPRGCIPTGLAVAPDGGFFVSHTNTGWGPNSTPGNADYVEPSGPYFTISKFDSTGQWSWSTDTFSDTGVGDGGFPNDIPTGFSDDASTNAISVDTDGNVYAGGTRRTVAAGTFSVVSVGMDRNIRWIADTGSKIMRGGLAVSSGGVLCATGPRNTAWTGSGGANAHLWKINKSTGTIERGFDLGKAVPANCCTFAADGGVIYGTDKA